MRSIVIVLLLTVLPGCSQRAVLVNDQGHRITCEVTAYGFVGKIMADPKLESCISDAKAQGYRLEE